MKPNKEIICILLAVFVSLVAIVAFTRSAFKEIGIQDTSKNPVQTITFISQGAPPQKSCELTSEDAINDFLDLLKKTTTIRAPFVQGGGGIVRANLVLADGSQHSLQIYSSNLASIDGTGVIIVSPQNFVEQVFDFVAICPDTWG